MPWDPNQFQAQQHMPVKPKPKPAPPMPSQATQYNQAMQHVPGHVMSQTELQENFPNKYEPPAQNFQQQQAAQYNQAMQHIPGHKPTPNELNAMFPNKYSPPPGPGAQAASKASPTPWNQGLTQNAMQNYAQQYSQNPIGQNTGDTGYFGHPQGQGGSYFGNPGGAGQGAAPHFPQQITAHPNALNQQQPNAWDPNQFQAQQHMPNGPTPTANPQQHAPGGFQQYSAPIGPLPSGGNLPSQSNLSGNVFDPNQFQAQQHQGVDWNGQPITPVSQLPYGSINAIEHAQGTSPYDTGIPGAGAGTGGGGGAGTGGGGGWTGHKPSPEEVRSQVEQILRENPNAQISQSVLDYINGKPGGGGAGGGASAPAPVAPVAPPTPPGGANLPDLINQLVAARPGQTFKIPPALQQALSSSGLYQNLITVLRSMGINGIGVIGPYGFDSDFILPESLGNIDLNALMAGMAPADQLSLRYLLSSLLGVGSTGQAIPTPGPQQGNPTT
jgi:hypothetical protein